MAVTKQEFGKTPAGEILSLYTIDNRNVSVSITDLGATLVSILVPDKDGNKKDVILGYDDAQGYYDNGCYFGAVIGRSGNRIDKGRFTIGGETYRLAINDNENNLHSGKDGFDSRKWDVAETTQDSVTFTLKDAHLQQGYPGNFETSVTYTLKDDNTLCLHYQGVSDADTVANMTNHVYFNLGGHESGDILGHEMMIEADCYTAVRDGQAIPTGEYAPVEGTPMDFRKPKKLGDEIDADFEQLKFVGGYDHNYVLSREKRELTHCASVYCADTGIGLEVSTDLPGVQLYAGNFINPDMKGKNGAVYQKRQGFCLETQYYPNSINQEGFASPLLKAGEKYDTVTCYQFVVK